MTAADLRAVADLLDRLVAAGFDIALELGGDLIIRAKPLVASSRGEPFSDGTCFDNGTGWVEQTGESGR